MKNIVIVSGGFDPLTAGHIDYLKKAAELASSSLSQGGEVQVLLNSDDWLTRKKGKPFMCFDERKKILEALTSVTYVFEVDDANEQVILGIQMLYDKMSGHEAMIQTSLIFANGGDRLPGNTPEVDLCYKLGIKIAFNVGGGKTQSSSTLLKEWEEK